MRNFELKEVLVAVFKPDAYVSIAEACPFRVYAPTASGGVYAFEAAMFFDAI